MQEIIGFSSQEKRLVDSLCRVNELFAHDTGLVEEHAHELGVAISVGKMFDPLKEGEYNARFPEGNLEEVRKLKNVKSLSVVCIDYRQSFQVVRDLELNIKEQKDAILLIAGGAVQPEDERFDVLEEFLIAFGQLNPEAKIMLTAHIGICGGADYFTKGKMKSKYEENPESEKLEMIGMLKKGRDSLLERAIDSSRTLTFLVHVADKEYKGIETLDFAKDKTARYS